MGYTLPSPDSPKERARALMARKDAIEAELEAQGSILRANNTDMRQPLVDREGFPRGDLDVWAVRHARVRIIELRNDLTSLMDEIAKTLEMVYSQPSTPPVNDRGDGTTSGVGSEASPEPLPFARVNGVAPGSPAADAVRYVVHSVCLRPYTSKLWPLQGLQREDLIVKFGELRHPQQNMQALVAVVAENENVRLHSVHVFVNSNAFFDTPYRR